jgi:uncharacterized membrane protein YoaK (UPF0700 family)
MNETSRGDTAFGISIGLAFVGGYADASSYLLARTFTGHLTGNCVLAAAHSIHRKGRKLFIMWPVHEAEKSTILVMLEE